MKILVIGGTGTIGKEVVSLLKKEHEVIAIGRKSGEYQMDLEDKASIEQMFEDIKEVDGVISLAGDGVMSPFHALTDEQLDLALNSKLKANINLIRVATGKVKENGFIIITTGTASHTFFPGASSISMAQAGIEAFVKAIQLERVNNVKINVVSPAAVIETLAQFNLEIPNSVSAKDTAKVYQKMVETDQSGVIADVQEYLNSEINQ